MNKTEEDLIKRIYEPFKGKRCLIRTKRGDTYETDEIQIVNTFMIFHDRNRRLVTMNMTSISTIHELDSEMKGGIKE